VNLITYVSNFLSVVFEVLSLVHENRRQVVVSSTQSCCVRHLVRSSVHLKGLSVVRLWYATRQLHHRRAQWYACSVGCLSSSMLTVPCQVINRISIRITQRPQRCIHRGHSSNPRTKPGRSHTPNACARQRVSSPGLRPPAYRIRARERKLGMGL